jgi:GntR family transcriptional regulator
MTNVRTTFRDRIPPGTALWAGLANELRSRVAAGEFENRMPTEAELVSTYKVSRATVREALRSLRAEGIIEARQGMGTFVVQRGLDEPLLGRPGLAHIIEASGFDERSQVLTAHSVILPSEVTQMFSLASDTPGIEIERLRFAGKTPVTLDHSFFVLEKNLHRAFLSAPLDRGSLYDLVSDIADTVVVGGKESVYAAVGDRRSRELLRVVKTQGLLALERITYAKDGPLEWRQSLLVGTRWRFDTTWGTVPT